MKIRRTILTLFLALTLLLSACGKRLDPETLALAEASDAVCMVRTVKTEFVPVPEGMEGSWHTAADGTNWGNLMECSLMEDFFDNLGQAGRTARVFVLLDSGQYPQMLYGPQKKGKTLFMYLNLVPGYTQRVQGWDGEEEYPVFTAGAIRWETLDRKCLRRMKAIRAWGRANPRKLPSRAAQ